MHDHAADGPAAPAEREISRRSALRKGVVLGAAPLWAVPTVQALGVSRADAQTPSPGPGTSTTMAHCRAISNIQLVVRHHGELYGLKYDGEWDPWSTEKAPDANDCIRFYADSESVRAARSVADLFRLGDYVHVVDDCLWELRLPPDCFFVAGWAKASVASAANCSTAQQSGDFIVFSTS